MKIKDYFFIDLKTEYRLKQNLLSSKQKKVLYYLYSYPTTNPLGCLVCKGLFFNRSFKDINIKETLNLLNHIGLFSFDAKLELLFLPGYLFQFSIKTKKGGLEIETLFREIPQTAIFYHFLVLELLCISHLSNTFKQDLRQIRGNING